MRMRIFTPGAELPMAGHPTIGSTFALAIEGVIAAGRERFVFELGVGPTPVSLEWGQTGLAFAWMTQPLPTFGAVITDRAAFAASVGLSARRSPPRRADTERLVRRAVSVRSNCHARGRRRGRDRSQGARAVRGRCRHGRAGGILLHAGTRGDRHRDGATAGCWRRALGLQKTRQRAARVARSARIFSTTAWYRPTRRAACSACRASRWDDQAAFTSLSTATKTGFRGCESAACRCSSGGVNSCSELAPAFDATRTRFCVVRVLCGSCSGTRVARGSSGP